MIHASLKHIKFVFLFETYGVVLIVLDSTQGVWDVVDQRDREGTGDELTLNMLVQGTDAPYPKIDYGPSEGSYVLAVFPDKEATGGADISPLWCAKGSDRSILSSE